MKILFIKQLFYPEPTARSLDFALELTKNGHQVQVLTGFPSYPKGEVYDGYSQRLFHREKIKGIDVIRVPIFPNQGNSGIKRILNYMSYAISATFLGLTRVNKPDVVFAYHGALPVSIPAMIYKFFRGVPFVYDINDLWPETLEVSGLIKSKFLLSVVERWCGIVYMYADRITVLSNGFYDTLISKGVPKSKLRVIYHWSRDYVDKDVSVNEDLLLKLFPSDKINFLYAGNMGIGQSLISILNAAKNLMKIHPKANFIFLGDGVMLPELRQYAKMEQLTNITFHPRVASNEVAHFLAKGDVLVVHLKDSKLFEITIPSKTISYLKSGKPILAGLRGNGAELIEQSDSGIVCIPDDIVDIQRAIIGFCSKTPEQLQMMGNRARKFYDSKFSIQAGTFKYIKVFNDLCEAKK